MSSINSWGLDVFTANEIIKDQRVLTCTTFKIFQERDLLNTFKIQPRALLSFLMTLEDHYLKVSLTQYYKEVQTFHITKSWYTEAIFPTPPNHRSNICSGWTG